MPSSPACAGLCVLGPDVQTPCFENVTPPEHPCSSPGSRPQLCRRESRRDFAPGGSPGSTVFHVLLGSYLRSRAAPVAVASEWGPGARQSMGGRLRRAWWSGSGVRPGEESGLLCPSATSGRPCCASWPSLTREGLSPHGCPSYFFVAYVFDPSWPTLCPRGCERAAHRGEAGVSSGVSPCPTCVSLALLLLV